MAKQPSQKSRTGTYFLFFMLLIYSLLFFFNKKVFEKSLDFFINILWNFLWIFIIVFFLMVLTNYLFTKERIIKYFGKGSKKRNWFFVILFGILSSGPIYMWYPLLADLKEKGMRIAFISAFLYNRAIKIPLLPLLLFYFSLRYAIVLLSVMIVLSILQGMIIEKILEVKK
jgi:uncharacterized membrane protein YraQ (UPF0718 family)